MLRKDVKEIKEQVNELSNTTLSKALKFDEMDRNVKCIKMRVKSCYTVFDERSMAYVVKVDYEVPQVTLRIDEGGAVLNDRFRAINILNLISYDDMEKISEQIAKAVKLNQQEE